jgi:hypothetical protein
MARDALGATIRDHKRKVAMMGSLATDRPLIDFVIKRKEMARWLHDLSEADRQEQKFRRRI